MYYLQRDERMGRVKKKSNNSGPSAADYLLEAVRVGDQPAILLYSTTTIL
jgi:hypothetical protein